MNVGWFFIRVCFHLNLRLNHADQPEDLRYADLDIICRPNNRKKSPAHYPPKHGPKRPTISDVNRHNFENGGKVEQRRLGQQARSKIMRLPIFLQIWLKPRGYPLVRFGMAFFSDLPFFLNWYWSSDACDLHFQLLNLFCLCLFMLRISLGLLPILVRCGQILFYLLTILSIVMILYWVDRRAAIDFIACHASKQSSCANNV